MLPSDNTIEEHRCKNCYELLGENPVKRGYNYCSEKCADEDQAEDKPCAHCKKPMGSVRTHILGIEFCSEKCANDEWESLVSALENAIQRKKNGVQ